MYIFFNKIDKYLVFIIIWLYDFFEITEYIYYQYYDFKLLMYCYKYKYFDKLQNNQYIKLKLDKE